MSLDRIIKRERNDRRKMLIKLRRARDMASKYTDRKNLMSELVKHYFCRFNIRELEFYSTSKIAKQILDEKHVVRRPPPPPSRPVTLKK